MGMTSFQPATPRSPMGWGARFVCRWMMIPVLVFSLTCSEGGDPPPNVLLISIDTLRADRLGCYGHRAPTSPFLDTLAARGVRFTNVSVNTHGTTPSHTTVLSGLYQETHGVSYDRPGESGELTGIGGDVPLVQEAFQRHGYTTLAVTGGGNVGKKFGFARGFDLYDDRGGGIKREARRLLRALDAAAKDRPVFAFLHTYEVHSPYKPPAKILARFTDGEGSFDTSSARLLEHSNEAWRLPPEDLEHIADAYDAGIRYTDNRLRSLFEELETSGFLDHALVVITSDHGEEFGEHGGLLHRSLLYDELLKVPLLILGEGVTGGRVVDRPVSSVDIAPTLLAFAGIEVPPHLAGTNLLADTIAERPIFSQYGGHRFAIRSGSFKLIEDVEAGRAELYDLEKDPREQQDLAADHPEMVTRLLRQLRQWKQSVPPRMEHGDAPELDEEEIEKLEALGYVG